MRKLTKQLTLKKHRVIEASVYLNHSMIETYRCKKHKNKEYLKQACIPQKLQPTNPQEHLS